MYQNFAVICCESSSKTVIFACTSSSSLIVSLLVFKILIAIESSFANKSSSESIAVGSS